MMLNIADGDRHTARGVDLAVHSDDAVHVVRAEVPCVLFCLQQLHPNLAMTEVTGGVCVLPLVAHRPFDGCHRPGIPSPPGLRAAGQRSNRTGSLPASRTPLPRCQPSSAIGRCSGRSLHFPGEEGGCFF